VAKFLALAIDGLLPVTISNPADYKKQRTNKYTVVIKIIYFMLLTCFGPTGPL
jgi:hypothetical protein